MSRTKKSRKPGSGSIGIVKDDKKKLATPAPRKPKKKTGKQAGNRQKEATASKEINPTHVAKKDPRIGNKTPIDLGKPVNTHTTQKPKKKALDTSPIAAIRKVDNGDSLAEQLTRIEQDPQLLAILEKQDNDMALTEAEVNHFNELMEQHQSISEKLGLSDEDEITTNAQKTDSEDDLWDKFDSSDLSKFE